MKRKWFKRSVSFLFAILMCLTAMSTAFAMESTAEMEYATDAEVSLLEVIVVADGEIMPLANTPDSGVVPSNGSKNFYPTLDSYIGITKKFVVNATSNSSSGALLLYLYNPSGKLVSKDWIMGVNEIVRWSLTLPSSGQWRLYVVAQGTTASVNVYTKWE